MELLKEKEAEHNNYSLTEEINSTFEGEDNDSVNLSNGNNDTLFSPASKNLSIYTASTPEFVSTEEYTEQTYLLEQNSESSTDSTSLLNETDIEVSDEYNVQSEPEHIYSDNDDDSLLESTDIVLPTLSAELKEDIERFSIEGYAVQYFSVRRKSHSIFFGKKIIPLNTLVSWSKTPLSYPLTELAKKFHKDALHAFKDIQKIMCERSGVSVFGLTRVPVREVQNLISLAINYGELRDELLCQVIKQITSNPSL